MVLGYNIWQKVRGDKLMAKDLYACKDCNVVLYLYESEVQVSKSGAMSARCPVCGHECFVIQIPS